MVLVEDVSSHSDSSPTTESNARPNASPPPAPPSAPTSSPLNMLLQRKTDAVLLLSRLATIFFALMYFLPIFRGEGQVYYSKALLSAIVTSVLRLRQRLPAFQFSREFLFYLIREDSAHYLLYSFLFLSSVPMTIVLIPPATYAILHSCSFIKQLCDSYPVVQRLCSKVIDHQINLLRFAALNEILLMPILILSIFVVRSNFLLIFMYYRFLTLRYTSQRNPYTRTLFGELRQTADYLCSRPSCPPIIARLCGNAIAFIERLRPSAA